MKKVFSILLSVCLLAAGIAVSHAQAPVDHTVILTIQDQDQNIFWVNASACFKTPDRCAANAVKMPDLEAGSTIFPVMLSDDGSTLYLVSYAADYSLTVHYAVDLASNSITVIAEPFEMEGYFYAPVGDQKFWYDWDENYKGVIRISDETILSSDSAIEFYDNVQWSPDAARLAATLAHPDQVIDDGSFTIKAGAPVECIDNFMAPACADYVQFGTVVPVCNSIGIADAATGKIDEITSSEKEVCLRFLGWLNPDQIIVGKTTPDAQWTLTDLYTADIHGQVLKDAQPDYLSIDSFLGMEHGMILVRTQDQTVLHRTSDGASAVVASVPETAQYYSWYMAR